MYIKKIQMLMNKNKGNEKERIQNVPKKCAKRKLDKWKFCRIAFVLCENMRGCVLVRKFGPFFDSIVLMSKWKKEKRYRPYCMDSIHIYKSFWIVLSIFFLSLVCPYTLTVPLHLLSHFDTFGLKVRSGFDVQKWKHRLDSITKYTSISLYSQRK